METSYTALVDASDEEETDGRRRVMHTFGRVI